MATEVKPKSSIYVGKVTPSTNPVADEAALSCDNHLTRDVKIEVNGKCPARGLNRERWGLTDTITPHCLSLAFSVCVCLRCTFSLFNVLVQPNANTEAFANSAS